MVKFLAKPAEPLAVPMAIQPVVADFDKPTREHMLKVPPEELQCLQPAYGPLFGLRVLIAEADDLTLQRQQTPVGNSRAKDVRRQIFQSGLPFANRLAVNHPRAAPDSWGNLIKQLRGFLFESVPEFGGNDFR